MAILDAKDFVNRTTFISEEEEDVLANEYLEFEAIVNASGTDNGETWVACSLMLDSDYESLVDLMDDDMNIDTDDLRNSSIPSFITRNNNTRGIINITEEQARRIRPGKRVLLDVTLNTDDQGTRYLNGAVIEVMGRSGKTADRSVDKQVDVKQNA